MNEQTAHERQSGLGGWDGWYNRDLEIGKERTVYPLSRAMRTTVENEGPSAEPVENSLKM
jgi:hypothetical protein